MSRIYVRTTPGRIARVSPRGEFIPSDKFVPVQSTAYMDRLINVHGDVQLRPAPAAPQKKPTPDSPIKS